MNPEKGWHQMDARFCTIVQYRCRAWWGRLRRTAGGVEAGDEHVSKIADVQSNVLEQGRGKKAAWGKRRKKTLNLPPITIFSNSQNAFSVFPAKKKKKKKKNHLTRVVFIVEKSILQPQPVHLPLKQLYRGDVEVK